MHYIITLFVLYSNRIFNDSLILQIYTQLELLEARKSTKAWLRVLRRDLVPSINIYINPPSKLRAQNLH